MGDYHSNIDAMDISPSEYRKNKFVIGIDTEKMLGAAFTGYNSKAGDLLTLRMRKQGSEAALIGRPDFGRAWHAYFRQSGSGSCCGRGGERRASGIFIYDSTASGQRRHRFAAEPDSDLLKNRS